MKIAKKALKLAEAFAVTDGKSFRLKDFDPADTQGIHSKEKAAELLQESTRLICDLQEKLYAQDEWAMLLVVQAMDAAGKDSLVKHVMSGVNPQGCEVTSFKQPSTEELDHDYLWRAARRLPERGHIGVFNRSYYEEVLVVRVHPEILHGENVPHDDAKDIWEHRFHSLVQLEQHLHRNGTHVVKFFLHLSKDEQRRR